MAEFVITQTEKLDPDEERAIRIGIARGDPETAGPRGYAPLCWVARGVDNQLVGGLVAAQIWGWIIIDALWVAEAWRGRGLGSQLLRHAERAAVSRGCTNAMLGTFDSQARGFYERHGYLVYGRLDGFPDGHTHFHMAKSLADSLNI